MNQLAEVIAGEKHFRWRGGHETRLEHFSDAVFAFAVTLLVVSLEVPRSFHELMEVLRGFWAFGVCFAMLALIWFYHCRFFRRYGLHGPWVTFLNSVLLFVVLFYTYPLKFLVSIVMAGVAPLKPDEFRTLFVIYGCGFAAVFGMLALLYWYAWSKRAELALDEIELLRTRHNVVNQIALTVIGLGSAMLALVLPEKYVGWAGYFYISIVAAFNVTRLIYDRKERRLLDQVTLSAAE